jgi:hypothetical protein
MIVTMGSSLTLEEEEEIDTRSIWEVKAACVHDTNHHNYTLMVNNMVTDVKFPLCVFKRARKTYILLLTPFILDFLSQRNIQF